MRVSVRTIVTFVGLATGTATPVFSSASQSIWNPLTDLDWNPVCAFVATVTRVDTVQVDRRTRGIRYHFHDIVFLRGGEGAHEAQFEVLVSVPRAHWGTYKGRRARIEPINPFQNQRTFQRGARYLVYADGVSQEGQVVRVAQGMKVCRLLPDSSGAMRLEDTNVSEEDFIRAFRRRHPPAPPSPIPNSHP
jgi:hypothetical protein